MTRERFSVAPVVGAIVSAAACVALSCTTLSGADRFAVGEGGASSSSSASSSAVTGGGGSVDPCDNGVLDASEEGIDCGGSCEPCAPGCATAADCATGFCVQDVCCNDACEAGCDSCRAADTIGPDGVCLPVRSGNDPKNACANAASDDPCGQTGTCDGASNCAKTEAGVVCGPASCAGPMSQDDPLECDGQGNCDATGQSSCAPYVCNELDDTGCLTTCTDEADCVDLNDYCNAGACVAAKPDGAACTIDAECANDYCDLQLDECSPAQCDNNAQNVGETDVDCGGVCGATCVTGQTCSVNGDCVSNNCATTCQ